MRPFLLDPLFQSIRRLGGVGDRVGKALESLAGPVVLDLLFHFPVASIDRRTIAKIDHLTPGMVATIKGKVIAAAFANHPGRPSKITIGDDTGELSLVFFKNPGNYLQKNFILGNEVVVSGRIEHYQGRAQMPHPDRVASPEKISEIAVLEPIYPLTAGVTNNLLAKTMKQALGKIPKLPEWLDAELIKREKFPAWAESLNLVHQPTEPDMLSPQHPTRRRMAYDEILGHQLALALTRQQQKDNPSTPIVADKKTKEKALAALPFALTQGQKDVLTEIENDLAQPFQMCRLLQGDVGSGKTVIAFLAAVHVISAKKQATIMAPTEILARQHLNSLQPLADKLGITIALLTGREKGKAREKILDDLATGKTNFLIGTHALIQEPVQFADLGLAIIDEQHRFGVAQRIGLAGKGKAVNILVMTATPIPRTLALTAYGDMDSSILREKPPGRKPIDTRVLPHDRIPEITASLKRKIEQGDRIYWVCPLVEESELIDLSAAEDRHADLLQHFPGRVGLVHGRLKGAEKDAVMADFVAGNIDILVATTVIEVGVNVPEATVMIIEHSERFGLSQLHQLRGRVGRGEKAGTCLLLYEAPLGRTAKQRLETMRTTEDGFVIAETDLSLRGAGDILGTQQSGELNFRLATLEAHQDLLLMAHQEVKLIVQKDPKLTTERGKNLRILLYLFERDQVDKFLAAG
jgi:ATP-dependent DNA helicase RecG